jgi:hypothetical protein
MTPSTITQLRLELESIYSTPYKHIAIKIESNWGTQTAHEYFLSVLNKNRPSRKGLPPEVYKSVFLLYSMHVDQFGNWNSASVLSEPNVCLGPTDQSES